MVSQENDIGGMAGHRYCNSLRRVREDTEAIRASGTSFTIEGFHIAGTIDNPVKWTLNDFPVDELPTWLATTGSLLVYGDIEDDIRNGKLIADSPPGNGGVYFFKRKSDE